MNPAAADNNLRVLVSIHARTARTLLVAQGG